MNHADKLQMKALIEWLWIRVLVVYTSEVNVK
jgi:hypothetical protein